MEFVDSIPKTAKYVEGTIGNYVDIDGSLYSVLTQGIIKKKLTPNRHNGYIYTAIRYKTGTKTVRLHRVIAKTFLDNDNCYDIVGHKNNIKHDNRVENLYWTTISENTKKAFDDGLLVNDSGHNDSQSKQCYMFNFVDLSITCFGSRKEAARITGESVSTITRHCNYRCPSRSDFIFMNENNFDDIGCIGVLDEHTDVLIGIFVNVARASMYLGVGSNVIRYQLNKSNIKYTKCGYRFKYISIKEGVTTIENVDRNKEFYRVSE